MSETAIVILNWNGLDYLKKFLGTVIRYSAGPTVEICVADNGSTDDSVQWVTLNHPSVRIIRLDQNYGFAGGYNLALEKIKAKYYVLLNSDIEVTTGWLEPLLRHMNENITSAACQPKILSWSRKDHFEYAGASGGFIDKYGYPFCRGRIFDNIEKDNGQYDSNAGIFWASGACMMVRAEAWNHCGGFDDAFFAHMEEIDLCWRFNRAGYKLECIPASVVYHVGGGTLAYDSPFKTYLNFRNSLFLLYKNLPQKYLKRTLFVRRVLDGIAAAMFLFKGRFGSVKAVWKAHMDYYSAFKDLKAKRENVQKTGDGKVTHVLNKSIVFEFYGRGKKTYSSLNMSTNQ
ncbi:MAG TPA: glycosyltransferase family 2 protein [Bacteroidales bacterium]|nr:glycosyltransferase family 2 protein [Bacteroidales bacterium]